MKRRYLVIYQPNPPTEIKPGFNPRGRPEPKAVLIDDDEEEAKMPYGVSASDVAEDCQDIIAIILCADAPDVPFVVIGDEEFKLSDPA